jgi:uncharacterized protein YdhG (YjbR/CyaY superfamily)
MVSSLTQAVPLQASWRRVSGKDIDAYLAALEEPKQATLRELRKTILGLLPEAEQCISYGMPAFRLRGKVIAGFRSV